MKTFKKLFSMILAIAMIACLFAGCIPQIDESSTAPTRDFKPPVDPSGSGGDGPSLKIEDIKGITDDTIWVGNTAGTTGALAAIGGPFNDGIQAAFAQYNAQGGFHGLQVRLKHYDDGGVGATSATLMEKLIHEDEVFAIVGNFAATCVAANLDIIKEAKVPMVYAAAGNDILLNENATEQGDRGIFPVQPLNKTEGRSLILRAFAPAANGGLGATKVGVIANSNEASQAMLAGIKAEAENLPAGKKDAIVYQEVATDDPSAAINALKDAGCDMVILTVIGTDFTTAIAKMVDAGCTWKVLTSYNNSSAAVFNNTPVDFNGTTVNLMDATFTAALTNMQIYSQGWINISDVNAVYAPDLAYKYKGDMVAFYQALGSAVADDPTTEEVDPYMIGFTEDYWKVAEALYAYAISQGKDAAAAFALSYDAYALAGYIAGDLFCQALAELQAKGGNLTRADFVNIMESKEFKIAMADAISFANGMRAGVEAFSLTMFYASNGMAASASVTNGVSSLEDMRAALNG